MGTLTATFVYMRSADIDIQVFPSSSDGSLSAILPSRSLSQRTVFPSSTTSTST
jgi:hypothetical protein